jgi:hypothetical protein
MSDIVWVAEDDWTKVVDGQRVRLTNDNGSLEGIAFQGNTSFVYLDRHGSNPFYSVYWKLFVQAKPVPVLPTEPGSAWHDRLGELWLVDYEGIFKCLQTADFGLIEISPDRAARAAPFTRLEPVPGTAKKVIGQVISHSVSSSPDSITVRRLVLHNILNDFEVTS